MDHAAAATTIASIARGMHEKLKARRDPFAVQNSDREDFIDGIPVWAIRDALEEAYQCGWADAEAHHKVQDA